MSISTLLLLFLSLAITSIFVVRVLDGRIVRKRVMISRAKQLLQKVEELRNATATIYPLFSSDDIPQILLDEQLDLLQQISQLSKKSSMFEAISAVESQKEELTTQSITQNRALTSDASIARHNVFLNEAGVVLLKRHKANKISADQFNHYIEELSWAKLMINVVPLIKRGEQLRQNGEKLKADSFLRKALKKAESSSLSDTRKLELITELKDYFAGKRETISTYLIPELSR